MASRLFELGAKTIKQFLLQSFFPHACLGCGRGLEIICIDCKLKIVENPQMISVCPGCNETIELLGRCKKVRCHSDLDGITSMASYSNPLLRNLLHEFKYNHLEEAGRVLQDIFAHWLEVRRGALLAAFAEAIVIPTPMHWYRQNLRGFNQSEMLAQVLAKQFNLEYNNSILKRQFKFKRQAEINDKQIRVNHVAGSVMVNPRPRNLINPGASALLVDDVTTTGATLATSAQTLKSIGFKQVYALTLLKG